MAVDDGKSARGLHNLFFLNRNILKSFVVHFIPFYIYY